MQRPSTVGELRTRDTDIRLAVLLLTLLLVGPGAAAQDPGPGPIRGDPENAKPDPRALGALGGEGIPPEPAKARAAGLRDASAGIEVTSLIPDGAGATGGLEVGDVIVGVGKRGLVGKLDPFLRLAELLEMPRKVGIAAEIRVRRAGTTVEVEVSIPGTAKHPKTCPAQCSRCAEIGRKALDWLVGQQSSDGSFPTKLGGTNGQVAVTTLAGLALLASGSTPKDGPHAESLAGARDWLVANAGTENAALFARSGKNWSQVNWALGYAPLLLARLQALDPRDEVKKKLEEIRDALLRNMEPTGGWAHGPRSELPYPLDYAELTATGNICLAALGEIRSLGIEVPAKKLALAVSYIDKSSDGAGGVGYSTRPGQQGLGAAGRTASALLALSRCGLTRHPLMKKLTSYLRRNLAELPHGHVSPDFHFFFGALACRDLGKKDWAAFMTAFRTEILSLWNGDGTFGVRPADTSRFGMENTDRTMGPVWRTATFAIILHLPGGRLDGPAASLRR